MGWTPTGSERSDANSGRAVSEHGISSPLSSGYADEDVLFDLAPLGGVVAGASAARPMNDAVELNGNDADGARRAREGLPRVMVVDDDELVLKAVSRLLGRLGFDISGHTCPREALRKFALDPGAYGAVISDFRMSGMDGLQLAEKILTLEPKLPILLVSGYTGDVDSERARRIGVSGVRSKPVPAQVLSDWLDTSIRRQAQAE